MKSFSLNKYPKNLKLLILLAIIAIIPLTVLAAQQQQEIRQRAAEGPAITPNPLDPACDDLGHHLERSILKNMDFEEGTNYWTEFKEGNAEVSIGIDQGYGIKAPTLKIESNNGGFKAGVYQTVSGLTAGKWYHAFYATAQEIWGPNGKDDGLPIKREIGIDPSGGTNPNSTNIVWGRSAGCATRNGCQYGLWKTLENENNPLVSFEATGDTATVFVRASGEENISKSNTWIDVIFLSPACQANFQGGNATATPTPSPAMQSSSACRRNTLNLIKNCDFEETIDLSNATGPDWRNTGIDPERGAGPGQYTNDLTIIQTADNGKAAQIGRENDTCSLPKTGGGGTDDLFRIFSETKQNMDVSNANKFRLSFDVQMKSRHSREYSAPFYVWSGFNDHISDGKEVFLAYTPHIEAGDSYCSEPFQSDYDCRTGFQGPTAGCNDIFNSWKRVTVDFTRSQLCGNCTDQRIFVGFGVSNNYDTLVKIDNIELTAEGPGGPIYPPSPTASPTPAQRNSPTPTRPANATPTPTPRGGSRPTFTPTPTFTPGSRPTPTPVKARSAAGRIPIACPTLPFTQGMQIGCFLFVTPTPH